MASVSSWFAEAQAQHQAGRLDQSEALYRRVVGAEPGHAIAWYQLGLVCFAQGKTADAGEVFERVLAIVADHVEARTQLGIVRARQGRLPEAIAMFRQAVALRPEHAKAHNNLGVALTDAGRHEEAIAAWREAVRRKPDYAEAYFNLGVGLASADQTSEAIEAYQQAIALRPAYAEACNNLGLLLTKERRSGEAVVMLQQAVRLRPDYVDAYNNLGLALADLGRFDEALTNHEEALRQKPAESELHMNCGTVLASAGRLEEALAYYQQSLRFRPELVEAHWNRALALLACGDYERGWPEYEWRWKRPRSKPREFAAPWWNGSSLEGKRIWLWSEQGLGDAIQFVRYASVLKARGATVLLECPETLVSLFSRCQGIDQCFPDGTPASNVDCHAPLMSLPALCGTTLQNLPRKIPYLSVDPVRVGYWRQAMSSSSTQLKIGIAWQGNVKHRWDRQRSLPLHWFASLASLAGVKLYSLQKGAGTEQIQTVRFPITDLQRPLDERDGTFHETAAAVASLDLIITCDSAVAHLAGALGARVWVLLSTLSDWRWLQDRDDSPWYPTMRLFRQETIGEWRQVIERVCEEIASCRHQLVRT